MVQLLECPILCHNYSGKFWKFEYF